MASQPKIYRSKMIGVEWTVIFVLFAMVDALQFFLVATVIVGTIIDIFFGAGLLLWLWFRGEFRNHETRNRILLAFLATLGAEAVPGLNIAPFWFFDVWFCWTQSRHTNKIADAQEKAAQEASKQQQIEQQQQQQLEIMEMRERQGIEIDTNQEMKSEIIKRNLARAEAQKQKNTNRVVQ